jgi:hypothetical protein
MKNAVDRLVNVLEPTGEGRVLSDIDRDDLEVCQSVDKEWWTDENLQLF